MVVWLECGKQSDPRKFFESELPKFPKLTLFYFKPYNLQSKHVLIDSSIGS